MSNIEWPEILGPDSGAGEVEWPGPQPLPLRPIDVTVTAGDLVDAVAELELKEILQLLEGSWEVVRPEDAARCREWREGLD